MTSSLRQLTWLFAGVIFAIAFQPSPASSEERLALVIGNSSYKHAPTLPNPVKDAELLSRTLGSVGFKVSTLLDGNREQMMRALLDFARSLRKPNAVGLFYYAGHGIQVNGLNYLLPVDADVQNEDEVRLQSISTSEFLQTLDTLGASSSRLNIVILDACRNNPFARGWRSVGRGLAPIEAPTGSFVAFSTAPGEVAYDGRGSNSPYAEGLSQAITLPGMSVEQVFKSARSFVQSATAKEGRPQVPWESTSLTGEFYFVPAPPSIDAVAPRSIASVMQEIHKDTRTEQISASKRGGSWVKFNWIRPTSVPADEECEIDLMNVKLGSGGYEPGTIFGDACSFTFSDEGKGRRNSIMIDNKSSAACEPVFYIRDKSHLTCISIHSRLEFLVRQAKAKNGSRK